MIADRNPLVAIPLGSAFPLAGVPLLTEESFRSAVLSGVEKGWRISAYFGVAPPTTLYAVLSDDDQKRLYAGRMEVKGRSFASLTPDCPQAHLFEREIAEQFGLVPEGHPWLKPVRYRSSWTGWDAWGRNAGEPIPPGTGNFFRVEGEQVHEVAVGPVHAGIIEPGHFRFQCHGEQVFHLEIALGYQHRGIEEALLGGPGKLSRHYAETVAGDSTIGHATSYCQIIEALSGTGPSARSQALRGIALELERLANHTGDLGALSGDVGFLPTMSFNGRLRGDFLNMTALLCGNRFGRDMVRPGGVGFDLEAERSQELLKRLASAEAEATDSITLLWDNQSVMARFEDTGPLKESAILLGIVGPAARASGLIRDIRFNQPSGIYRFAQIPVSTCETGDVFARAYLRWLEIQRSIAFIRDQIGNLSAGTILQTPAKTAPDCLAVAMNEGWRGEICHVGITDASGRFARYKIVDPSFHNWIGLALALRDQEISDFPLCNKSFNLSYCGHDL